MERTIFVQLLLSFPLDGRDWPVTANATTVILMKKGINATSHASLRLFSRQEYTAERCSAVLSLKLMAYPSQVISASTHCSCQPGISLWEWLTTVRHRLCSGKSLHVTIYDTNSPGSCKSWLLITALYSLHTYWIVVITTPLREIGRGMTSVVGCSVVTMIDIGIAIAIISNIV